MEYQVVIKLWRRSLEDEGFLATIDDALRAALGPKVEQEGHDLGNKEVVFYMMADDPRQAFRKARDVFTSVGVERGMSAAYRLVGGAQFTSIWPLRPMRKFSLA